jgi:hypothetical protein
MLPLFRFADEPEEKEIAQQDAGQPARLLDIIVLLLLHISTLLPLHYYIMTLELLGHYYVITAN